MNQFQEPKSTAEKNQGLTADSKTEGNQEAEKQKRIRIFIDSRRKFWESELLNRTSDEVCKFLSTELKQLLITSLLLSKIFETLYKDVKDEDIKPFDLLVNSNDYSFIVLPAAKAFEGYLKTLLIKLRLLEKSDLKKDPFRSIGKIINSDNFEVRVKDKRFRHVPKEVQAEWDKSRNYLLHFDVDKPLLNSREESDIRIIAILKVIKDSFDAYCEH